MQTRRLGRSGPEVSALGMGLMAMSGAFGEADEAESLATVEAALDAGITLFDTGDFYGMGHNEMLLGRALGNGRRERAVVAVKFGALRDPAGRMIGFDGRPEAARNFLAYSLQRLGLDYVDLYMPARLDPQVPIEETVGAVAELVEQGYVRHVGLSEVSAETVRRAHAVHPIASLQIEYSLFSRGIEASILPTLRELGIATVAYGVVSHGLIDTSPAVEAARDAADPRQLMGFPRFKGENFEANRALVARMGVIAAERSMTVGQLAFAWVLSRGEDIIPLVGTKRRERLAETLGALETPLDAETTARLETAVPADAVAGERYPPEHMAALDSERPSAP